MHVLYPRCCGLEIHKKTVVACVLLTDQDGAIHRLVRTFGTMTSDLLALGDWLSRQEVTHVAMESTGVLWRPVFNVLEEGHSLILVNAQHIKTVPGRKTDVKDSEWLAELLRHGLLRPSFIPPPPIRVLRDLTRYRKSLVELRTQEINRIHKVLETANLKLGAVASNVVGVSGAMLRQRWESIRRSWPSWPGALAREAARAAFGASDGCKGIIDSSSVKLLDHNRLTGPSSGWRVIADSSTSRTPRPAVAHLARHGPVTAAAIIADRDLWRAFPALPLAPGRGLSGEPAQCRQTTQWRGHQGQHAAQDHPVRDRRHHRPLPRHLSALSSGVLSSPCTSARQAAGHAGRGPQSPGQQLLPVARSGALSGLGTRALRPPSCPTLGAPLRPSIGGARFRGAADPRVIT